MSQSRNTIPQAEWFRLVRFRSPLLTQSRLIYFPSGTEMFHFPESHFYTLCIQMQMISHNGYRVAPFGYLRIKVCVPLPEAFRSLPRPSSPRDAKASIVCPYTLGRRVFLSSISRLRCNFSFPDYAIFKDQVPLPPKRIQLKLPLRYCDHTVVSIKSVKANRRLTGLPFYSPLCIHCVVAEMAKWWACLESNQGLQPYQGCALTD